MQGFIFWTHSETQLDLLTLPPPHHLSYIKNSITIIITNYQLLHYSGGNSFSIEKNGDGPYNNNKMELEAFDHVVHFKCGQQQIEDPQGEEESGGGVFGAVWAAQFTTNTGASAQQQDHDGDGGATAEYCHRECQTESRDENLIVSVFSGGADRPQGKFIMGCIGSSARITLGESNLNVN